MQNQSGYFQESSSDSQGFATQAATKGNEWPVDQVKQFKSQIFFSKAGVDQPELKQDGPSKKMTASVVSVNAQKTCLCPSGKALWRLLSIGIKAVTSVTLL